VSTAHGVLVADVAWCSDAFIHFMQTNGAETPFCRAPAICIEIASPS
jgi:hypothetical protein